MLVSRNKAFLMTLPKAWDPSQSPHLLPAWQLHRDLQVSLLQVLPSTICFCPQQYIFRRKLRGKLIVSLFHAYAISVAHGKVGAHCPVTTIPHHCLPSCTWASATGITLASIGHLYDSPQLFLFLGYQSSSLSDVISHFHLHMLPSWSTRVGATHLIYDSVHASVFRDPPTLLPILQASGQVQCPPCTRSSPCVPQP